MRFWGIVPLLFTTSVWAGAVAMDQKPVPCPQLKLNMSLSEMWVQQWSAKSNNQGPAFDYHSPEVVGTIVTTPAKVEGKKITCMGTLDDQVIVASAQLERLDSESFAGIQGSEDEFRYFPKVKWDIDVPSEWNIPDSEAPVFGSERMKLKSLTEKKVTCVALLKKRAIFLEQTIEGTCELPSEVVGTAFLCQGIPTKVRPFKAQMRSLPKREAPTPQPAPSENGAGAK